MGVCSLLKDPLNDIFISNPSSILYLSGLPMFGVSPGANNISVNGHPGGIVSYFDGVSSSYQASYSIHWILQNSGRINFYYASGTTSSSFQQQWLGGSSRFIISGRYYLADLT